MSDSSIFACPVCGHRLKQTGQQYVCDQGHSFDIARQGYVNLLLAHQRGSSQAGDNREMMHHRHHILEQGYYQPLAHSVSEQIPGDSAATVLDLGCGEGYYGRYLQAQHPALHSYGIDISKAAIKLAARQADTITYAVANTYHLPIADHVIDYALVIFAPFDEAAIYRALQAEGQLIIVTPAHGHLATLRALLYEQLRPYDQVRSNLSTAFTLIEQHHLKHTIHLNTAQDIQALLQMTPFYWRATPQKRATIFQLESLETTLSFTLSVYRKG